MPPKKIGERAATRVARNIARDVRERALQPGARLDPEHVMVERQGVARGTVREALRLLEMQGAVTVKAGPSGGPMVSAPDLTHLTSALSLQLQFANAPFRAVLEARRSIYAALVADAARHATPEDIAALREALTELHDALDNSDATVRAGNRFFERIAQASHNLVLGFLVNALHRLSEGPGVHYHREQRSASACQAAQVVDAIECGNADLARALAEHTLAAAMQYWEDTAPELLNEPVAWIAGD